MLQIICKFEQLKRKRMLERTNIYVKLRAERRHFPDRAALANLRKGADIEFATPVADVIAPKVAVVLMTFLIWTVWIPPGSTTWTILERSVLITGSGFWT